MKIYYIEIFTAAGFWWRVAQTDNLNECLKWMAKYQADGVECRYIGKVY